MRIIFFGSDDFALVHLEKLLMSPHEVAGCVTQPDKPKGRHYKISVSPIKECAARNNIPLLQPPDFHDPEILKQLKQFQSDLFVVIAYGQILPEDVLAIPKIFAVNVHGSLLPKYRGAAPINRAIINGDNKTGLSIIKMNPKMDAGDIISADEIIIDPLDTSITLRQKMAYRGSRLLLETITAIEKGKHQLTVQDESQATFAPKLTKDSGKIDWSKAAEDIHNLVRGLLPWPGAYTNYKGKKLKIVDSLVMEPEFTDQPPGVLLEISKQGLLIQAADKALLVRRVHLESAKEMDALSFARGQDIEVGVKFE